MIKTEVLNIIMLFVAFVTALVVPFDLFLFAYAFLGPLHYLTEIRWLHTRKYFVAENLSWLTILFSIVVTAITLTLFWDKGLDVIVIIFFLLAVLFVFPLNKFLFASIILSIFLLFLYVKTPIIILAAVLLPTLIHVYFFTFVFMLQSALRNRGILYFVAPTLHVVFGILCVYLGLTGYSGVSTYTSNVFLRSQFDFSNTFVHIGGIFFAGLQGVRELLISPEGIAITRLFAFAYTYHYLNWFIKTKIIGWSSMSRKTAVIIVFLWLISLSLYVYDYLLGMAVLALLSVTHVILEFPLNIRSIANILGKSSKT